jgi:hypothetical protein
MEKEGLRLDMAPGIFVHFDGSYYPYEGDKNSLTQLLHFINKIITPVLELQTEEDLINFLDLEREPNETTKFF